jgi:hypothetical protein
MREDLAELINEERLIHDFVKTSSFDHSLNKHKKTLRRLANAYREEEGRKEEYVFDYVE